MFTEFNYVPVVLTVNAQIGEAGKTTVYVRKFNASIDTDPYDKGTLYIAISSALRAPRLPGPLGRRRRALHLSRATAASTTCSAAASAARPCGRWTASTRA